MSTHAPTPGRTTPAHPVLLYTLIAVMVLLWSFNFIIGKVGLRHLDPLTLASFRVVLAAVITVALYLIYGGRRPSRQALWKFVQLGFLGVFLNQVLFTVGLHYTTAGHSALIIGAGPIWILLLARLHRLEPLRTKKLVGMLLSFAGVAVLAGEQGFSLQTGNTLGDVITLCGSVAFALYTVMGKKVALEFDSLQMNTYNYLTGAVLVLPLALRQAMRLDWAAVPWEGWAALVYMAVGASVLAYLIYYWALGHLSASRLATFSYFHPLLGTILGVTLLNEPVTAHLVAGGALVLVGVYLAEVGPGGD